MNELIKAHDGSEFRVFVYDDTTTGICEVNVLDGTDGQLAAIELTAEQAIDAAIALLAAAAELRKTS